MSDTTFINGTVIVPDWLNDVNDATYTKLVNVTTISAAAATILDDASTSAMLTTLGGAPLASPTFTGTVTLPSGTVGVTAAASDNDTSIATTAFVQQELTSQAVKLTGAQTVAGVKTFSDKPIFSQGLGSGNTNQSCIRVHTSNGYGSTNTKIKRFTTVVLNQGTDITYSDSATLGALFTINVAGVYAVNYTDSGTSATQFGVSLNGTALTTNIESIAASERIAQSTAALANGYGSASTTIYLPSGSLVRPHTGGVAIGATDNTMFTITRVS